MAKVVVTNKIPTIGLDLLKEAGHEVVYHSDDECITREACLELVKGADGILTLLTEKVDSEFLEAAGEQLKVVSNVAVGFNNIDVSACEGHGVVATNTPRVLTETTADTAFGLILMVTRRFGEAERVIRRKEAWQWGMFYMLGMGLQGKTLGVVGMGQIGVATARRAKAFGMDIVYTDTYPVDRAVEASLGAKRMELDELLEVADVVTVHVPYMTGTHHLFGAEQFKKMKNTAFIVNTARGPLIDEAALIEALRNGEIAGAGLDVYENEPTVPDELLEMENVVLLPHLGSATTETREAMAELAAKNCIAVLAGEPALTPVTHR